MWLLTAVEWLASSGFSHLPDLRLSPGRFLLSFKCFRPKPLESRKKNLGLVI